MKAAAFDFIMGRSEGVGSAELARALFKADSIGDELSKKLIGSWLGADSRFWRDDRGLWHIDSRCLALGKPYNFLSKTTFTVIDVETTGGMPPRDKMTEVAALKVEGGQIIDQFSTLFNPGRYIPPFITKLTGITNEMVSSMPTIEEVIPKFLDFIGSSVIVAHYSPFDLRFINSALVEFGLEPLKNDELCTCRLARRLLPDVNGRSLDSLAAHFGIEVVPRHRALPDAVAAAKILIRFLEMLHEKGVENLDELLRLQRSKRRRSSKA